MIYEDLYRQYEQNDVMHRGVCAVELAEKEVDGFLRSLSKELREQADELFGKLARAYEIQGFLSRLRSNREPGSTPGSPFFYSAISVRRHPAS